MVLIISRVILFMILALALGVMTAFPEQKLPLYIVFTLFVAVAIIMNVWFTHQNIKKNIIKFNKYVTYLLAFVSGLLYVGFVIYPLTIGGYDVLPTIIFAISIISIQILESVLGISLRNTHLSNKQLKVISKQRVQQFKIISITLVSLSIMLILIALMLKWWLLLVICIIILIIITIGMIVFEKFYTTSN
ncbi:TPA: hypothetical protein RRM88_001901 [Staphylococcus argenteus]|uniref:hypothetical protein n=1 Tax=Staphylococcus argenteus TaxID=985002 RepID=UPI0005044499|nr:hypothetical protein [Staphylococcus argenteus]MDT3005175.1 hypothetical protein [Staphylococcus argenteus]UPO20514.1 hypothetical protein M0D62_11635 [Staphylococcus argenteus]CDR64019.1 membrane spanning protein [Staphylococcus argenteus]HDY9446486.1 hypothetical protein [Staphylococcus argenteus]HDY9494099.1 hypothetical protein [Staphylococcus argenteus]